MRNAFVSGIAIGALAAAALSEADIDFKGLMKKGKKLIKRKFAGMM